MNPEDGAELSEFVSAHGRALLRTAYVLTGDAADAEDLLQRALESLVRKWHAVARADHPELYVRRIMVNLIIDGHRRQRRRPRLVFATIEQRAESSDSRFDDRDQLRAALCRLPPRQRATVVLRYLDGLDTDEVAQLLGCSPGTVKSQLSRGLAALREAIPALVEDGPRR